MHSIECPSIECIIYNIRRPLDRFFAFCDPVTLTFDVLILYSSVGEVSWWTIPITSLAIVLSTVLERADKHTNRQTHTEKESYIDTANRYLTRLPCYCGLLRAIQITILLLLLLLLLEQRQVVADPQIINRHEPRVHGPPVGCCRPHPPSP